MKAFINHWNKEIKPYIHNPADKELAEYWWRAALEWMLETRPMDRFGSSKVNCIQVSDIKKELEQ